jgi:hypothetical protein
MSALERVATALNSVIDDLAVLMRDLAIRHFERVTSSGVVFIAPEHYWGEATAEQKHAQIGTVRRYKQLVEIISVWLYDAPKDLHQELESANKKFTTWLELQSNWALSPDRAENERLMRDSAKGLLKLIGILAAAPKTQVLLVPDTNSLLREPDPVSYRRLSGVDAFEFILLPTVLQELDSLKIQHRTPEVREKAQKVIARIKGWRNQGSLLEGVVVDRSLRVRALHKEPDLTKSLSWLDPTNADDRIVASVLHIQASAPSARVVLVTGDINLQNKADAAFIEVGEI